MQLYLSVTIQSYSYVSTFRNLLDEKNNFK